MVNHCLLLNSGMALLEKEPYQSLIPIPNQALTLSAIGLCGSSLYCMYCLVATRLPSRSHLDLEMKSLIVPDYLLLGIWLTGCQVLFSRHLDCCDSFFHFPRSARSSRCGVAGLCCSRYLTKPTPRVTGMHGFSCGSGGMMG